MSSCSGTNPAYMRTKPIPVAIGAAMLRPMNSTPTSTPTEMAPMSRPGVQSRNFFKRRGTPTCATYTNIIGTRAR